LHGERLRVTGPERLEHAACGDRLDQEVDGGVEGAGVRLGRQRVDARFGFAAEVVEEAGHACSLSFSFVSCCLASACPSEGPDARAGDFSTSRTTRRVRT